MQTLFKALHALVPTLPAKVKKVLSMTCLVFYYSISYRGKLFNKFVII